MRVRPLLIATAIVSSLLGAVIAYLVLTVPNDLKSGALLKQARAEIAAGKSTEARKSLSALIQQYPRTDAAAAATVALVALVDQEQSRLTREIKQVQTQQQKALQSLAAMNGKVEQLAQAPPEPVIEQPAPPKPKPKIVVTKHAPAKKTSTPRKATPKRRSRRR
jgi:hypothetical protein